MRGGCGSYLKDCFLKLSLVFFLSLLITEGETLYKANGRCSGCIVLKQNVIIKQSQNKCFVYKHLQKTALTGVWSATQVRIDSTDAFQVENLEHNDGCSNIELSQEFFKCILHQNWWVDLRFFTSYKKAFRQDEDVCLRVVPEEQNTEYSVTVKDIWPDPKLVAFTIGGLFLFFSAPSLSRSAILYYAGGITLGIFATTVFLLLALKRYLPGGPVFFILMLVGFSVTTYVLHFLGENMNELWAEYKTYATYYLLGVGLFSFTVCYQLGPLTNKWILTLLTWFLQLFSFILLYWGLAIPEVAYALVTVMVFSRSLRYPYSALCYGCRKFRGLFRSGPVPRRLLTEEEYREQGDVETHKALDELRKICRTSEFPSWLIVSKLHSPKRFANFLLGDSHVLPNEIHLHEQSYGLGGSFLEDQLFQTDTQCQPEDRYNQPLCITEYGQPHQKVMEDSSDYNQWQLALIN
ncbi:nuclear envelope integral membrane protein 2-like [Protopterus annectens]|uniref:nuclear envelope integral membrane protein 2-like n=1 Tax=Protopterus annectens TaxID=7888 RepID=UPI001CFB7494|nr:nuclear envelope integral membrane protein 2-like [Protopterus annectens]